MTDQRDTEQEVWYADGLRFECTRCCRCCGGAPGYVWVDDEAIERIAAYLQMPVRRFRRDYCRNVWWRISLKEKDNGDCVLLGPDGCRVYPVRPVQCQTFPFWPDVVADHRRWESISKRCPGIGRGRLYSREEIEEIAARRHTT